MRTMSETYQSKRERWQRLIEQPSLPGLREHVALRNVEAVAALPPQAQARLLEAIRSGLKRLPAAVEKLKANPNLPVAELLEPTAQAVISENPSIQAELADMIQLCFPDMPRVSAEALADASLMDVARIIGHAHNQMLASEHLKTDFVMMVLYGLMRQTLDQLEEIIEQTPSLRQALEKAPCPGNPTIGENEMLKRIASTGINLVVLGVSVGIFLVAFIALNALGAAQKPPTVSVLSATRDLNIGDVLTADDLAVKTVFQDDNAAFIFLAMK